MPEREDHLNSVEEGDLVKKILTAICQLFWEGSIIRRCTASYRGEIGVLKLEAIIT